MAGYFFPFETLLSLGFPLRLLASSLIVGVPVGLASLIFSTSFKEEKNLSNVLGSNLLGVVFGGALEYTSNIWGLNTLYILALILYLLSSLPKLGNFKREAHSIV
jgi:MFS superfamily sulfate permease-like transporter